MAHAAIWKEFLKSELVTFWMRGFLPEDIEVLKVLSFFLAHRSIRAD